jgi:hypothetical protein
LYGVGWRTVQAALASAWPAQRAPYPTRASKLDPFKPVIDAILIADLDAPRKQRHTITRIFDRLCAEQPALLDFILDGNTATWSTPGHTRSATSGGRCDLHRCVRWSPG